jgi:3-dehydrosphinganine reductase
MSLSFQNQKILLTGGSSGIGKALAKHFLLMGANVVLCARDEIKLIQAKSDLLSISGRGENAIDLVSVDITNYDDVNRIFSKFKSPELVPDILINCAGVAHPGEFLDLDLEKFHWLMDTNYFGTVHTIKCLSPYMIDKGKGYIVNICSAAGFIGTYGYTAYCGSKFAVRGFSDALRSEFKLKNIDLSLVFPPDTDTPQLAYESQFKPDITRELAGNAGILSADEVAQVIIKGIQKKRYIIVPGSENAFLYHLSNILGPNVYKVMDMMVKQVINRLQRS